MENVVQLCGLHTFCWSQGWRSFTGGRVLSNSAAFAAPKDMFTLNAIAVRAELHHPHIGLSVLGTKHDDVAI